MRILIAGAGGLGCYFGGLLKRHSFDVDFLARGRHLEAIKRDGLKIKSVHGDFTISAVEAFSDIDPEKPPYDIILLSSKTTDLDSLSCKLKNSLKTEGNILHIQNGLDAYSTISKYFNPNQVITGIAYIVSTIESPGTILQKSSVRKLQFGNMEGSAPSNTFKRFEKACSESEIDIQWTSAIQDPLIEKFIFISAFSGLTSYYKCTLGELLSDPTRYHQFESCLKETTEVTLKMRSHPVAVDDVVQSKIEFSKSLESNLTSSLQADFANQKLSELNSLTGKVVKLGAEQSIPTPINDMIYQKLREDENGFKRTG